MARYAALVASMILTVIVSTSGKLQCVKECCNDKECDEGYDCVVVAPCKEDQCPIGKYCVPKCALDGSCGKCHDRYPCGMACSCKDDKCRHYDCGDCYKLLYTCIKPDPEVCLY